GRHGRGCRRGRPPQGGRLGRTRARGPRHRRGLGRGRRGRRGCCRVVLGGGYRGVVARRGRRHGGLVRCRLRWSLGHLLGAGRGLLGAGRAGGALAHWVSTPSMMTGLEGEPSPAPPATPASATAWTASRPDVTVPSTVYPP